MQPFRDHPVVSDSEGVADHRSNDVSLRDHDPEFYYDHVMPAWRLIMGRNLHYGYFQGPKEELDAATDNLTLRMAKYAELEGELELLDVGCGDGQNSCFLAEHADCRVVGISTGRKGVEEANRLSHTRGLSQRVTFLLRDGMNNGFSEGLFDRVWVMQSSHFMLDKRRLFHECVRVLRPGGRVVLGDIMLRFPLPRLEVMRQREKFLLLHRVFGRAKMEPLQIYQSLAEECGLRVDVAEDISTQTFLTFERWRQNAVVHRDEIIALIGETLWRDFLSACAVLEGFWERGWLGYGILAGDRPLESVASGAVVKDSCRPPAE